MLCRLRMGFRMCMAHFQLNDLKSLNTIVELSM